MCGVRRGTIVPGLNGSKGFPVLFYQVGKLEHQIASLGRRKKLPGIGFEGLAGGLGGQIDIFFAGGVDRCDFLLVAVIVSFDTETVPSSEAYEGLIEANLSPDLEGTNSLLINNPIG